MNNVRSKASQNRNSHADSLDYSFNQYAGGLKVMGPIFGRVKQFLGPLNAAGIRVDMGSLIAVYNNSASAVFVTTASGTPAAPTAANGIAIPPNAYLIIPMGPDQQILASAAAAIGYWLEDDLQYNPNSGSNS